MTTQPDRGDPAPTFTLPTNGGGQVDLRTLRGRRAVLYFYPKADTSGCTQQARDFAQAFPALNAAGVAVVGLSRDPLRALDRFAAKLDLPFPLASDTDGSVCAAYGCWVEKSMYGRKYMGIERSTFLLDPDGRIVDVWRKVSVPGHVAAVTDQLGLASP